MHIVEEPKSLIIFASGNGSNTEAIIQHFYPNNKINVQLIVCNKPNAGVLTIALKHNIPFLLVDKKTIGEKLIVDQLKQYKPDLIILAGFLWKMPENLTKAFPNKIINIHPALLPKYGGKGMYGKHVHEAVFAAREKESGITIHYVNDKYDDGAPILQARCTILSDDRIEDIAQKVQILEHTFYPKTIEYLLHVQ